MGGINSINGIVSPVNSCEGTQDKKENSEKSSLNFSQMLFDNIQREKKCLQLQQKKEDEEDKNQETKQPDTNNTIHQQYMLMSYVISSSSSKKKEDEEKK